MLTAVGCIQRWRGHAARVMTRERPLATVPVSDFAGAWCTFCALKCTGGQTCSHLRCLRSGVSESVPVARLLSSACLVQLPTFRANCRNLELASIDPLNLVNTSGVYTDVLSLNCVVRLPW